jgi:DNA-binding MarR family transcriptional regulator
MPDALARTRPASNSDDIASALDDHPPHLLRRAHQRACAAFQEALAGKQLTPSQFFAMVRLNEVDRLSQNHLGRLAAMDPATIQGVVRRLLERGLIMRVADPHDRRRKVLSLTREGAAVTNRLLKASESVIDGILAPLNAREQELLIELLKRIV